METLDEFRATARTLPELSAVPHFEAQEVYGPGRSYASDTLYIQGPDDAGAYCLTIENMSKLGELEVLERELYEFALSQDWI